jgi:L-amino acid N-acyltransferase YncA
MHTLTRAASVRDSALTIRPAQPSDWPAIWKIFHEVVAAGDSYAYPPDVTEDDARAIWFADSFHVYVAEIGRAIAGTYKLGPNQPGLGSHIANAGYMVASAFRGRGLGRRMCEHSMEEARRLGFRAMQFNFVVSTNESAVRLWQQCGFKIVGTVPQAFRHAKLGLVDVYVMHRFL